MNVDDETGSHPVRAGETLLEAGLRAGLDLPYECRNGACGLCMCTVHHGRVDHGPYQQSALTEAMRAQGQTLMCCATPLSDVAIEVQREPGAQKTAHKTHVGKVTSLERLADDLIRLRIALPEGEHIAFAAGQYINIILPDGQRRAYSFANAPDASAEIELHVGLVPGGRFTGHVFNKMQVGDSLRFEGPLGKFVLHESERPILFVAGATGFAPVKSIVEDAFQRGLNRPMWLYWGVRQRANLYLADLAEQWQREHDNFHFVPVLSEAGRERRLARAPGSGARGHADRFPRHAGLRDLSLRLGTHGRCRGAGLHGNTVWTRTCASPTPFCPARRAPARLPTQRRPIERDSRP